MLVLILVIASFQVSEAIFIITSTLKDVCGKPPNERLFLDKYGRICLCLDEIVWTVCRDFFFVACINHYLYAAQMGV